MNLDKEPRNPYSPPESGVDDIIQPIDNGNEIFIPGAQSVPAGEGVNWIGQAWHLIKPKLGMWILLGIIMFLIMLVVQVIPVLNIATMFLIPIFNGGIMAVCEKQRTTGIFDLELMFSGFKKNLGPLIGVGAIMFGMMMASIIVLFIFGSSALFATGIGSNSEPNMGAASAGLLAFGGLMMFVVMMIGYALTWFAPALIMIHDIPLGKSISMSFSAVKKNLLPGLIYFIIVGIIMFIAMIPMFLGLLIVMPLFMVTYYSSYRSLFIANK